jgi:hypothetical protein
MLYLPRLYVLWPIQETSDLSTLNHVFTLHCQRREEEGTIIRFITLMLTYKSSFSDKEKLSFEVRRGRYNGLLTKKFESFCR